MSPSYLPVQKALNSSHPRLADGKQAATPKIELTEANSPPSPHPHPRRPFARARPPVSVPTRHIYGPPPLLIYYTHYARPAPTSRGRSAARFTRSKQQVASFIIPAHLDPFLRILSGLISVEQREATFSRCVIAVSLVRGTHPSCSRPHFVPFILTPVLPVLPP